MFHRPHRAGRAEAIRPGVAVQRRVPAQAHQRSRHSRATAPHGRDSRLPPRRGAVRPLCLRALPGGHRPHGHGHRLPFGGAGPGGRAALDELNRLWQFSERSQSWPACRRPTNRLRLCGSGSRGGCLLLGSWRRAQCQGRGRRRGWVRRAGLGAVPGQGVAPGSGGLRRGCGCGASDGWGTSRGCCRRARPGGSVAGVAPGRGQDGSVAGVAPGRGQAGPLQVLPPGAARRPRCRCCPRARSGRVR